MKKIILSLALIGVFACDSDDSSINVEEFENVLDEGKFLSSFSSKIYDNFSPVENIQNGVNVILINLDSEIRIWGQYSEENTSKNEWEIVADKYEILKDKNSEIYKIEIFELKDKMILPNNCNDCLGIDKLDLLINRIDTNTLEFRIQSDSEFPTTHMIFKDWVTFESHSILN